MIIVDSSLQLYTTVIGWKYYGVIWSLLVSTGIVFVPVVMTVVGELLAARSRGAMVDNDAGSLLSGLEMRLVSIFLVMLFVAMPASPFELNPNTVTVVNDPNKLTTSYNAPAVGTCGATGTIYDGIEASDGEPICENSSRIPIWWYGVLRVSHAITQVVVTELTSATNVGFRYVTQFMKSGKIVNPELQSLANLFEGQCYQVALRQYSDYSKTPAGAINDVLASGGAGTSILGQEIDWQGARFLVEDVYPGIITESLIPVSIVNFQPELNNGVVQELNPEAGYSSCSELWAVLEQGIFEEARSPLAGSNRANEWERALTYFGPLTSQRQVDFLVQNYLQNSDPVSPQTVERINAMKNRGDGNLQELSGMAQEFFQSEEFGLTAVRVTAITDALVKILPIMQAYMLMFMVFMMPFAFLLSGYSWGFVLQASVFLFFVIFWSAIWAFAAWADDSLARLLWPGSGDGVLGGIQSYLGIGVDNQSWEQGSNKLIHSIVTAALYLGGPIYAGWMLAAAGYRAGLVANAAGVSAGSAGTGGLAPAGATARSVGTSVSNHLGNADARRQIINAATRK